MLRVLLAGGDDALDQRRERLPHVEIVGMERLGAGIAGALDPPLIGGVVMRHHHHRRVIEAAHLQARFLPDRKVHRREHAGHALLAQPVLGRLDQRLGDVFVLGLDRPPVAGARPHALLQRQRQRQFIDVRRYAPHDPAVALCQEELVARMVEERVLSGRELCNFLLAQIRDPILIRRIEAIGEVDEGGAVGLAGDGCND
jgi:hypothetical protein